MRSRYNHRNRRKYNLKAHIVLVMKYRKALLQNGIDDFVKRYMLSCQTKQLEHHRYGSGHGSHSCAFRIRHDGMYLQYHQCTKKANNTLPVDSIQNISCQILLEEAYLLV